MVAPQDCPEIECWQALLDADVPPDQLERVERHLESCPNCQERLDLASDEEEELRRFARRVGDPTLAPPDPTLSQLLERLQESHELSATPSEPADLYFLRASDRPDLLGTLGDYEVHEVIGQGGMGVVLKAYEPALHRLVAIKVMAAAVAGSAHARRRFTREAQSAAAVCHENVVAVHGVHEIDGLPYLVMQHIAGESLQDRLNRIGMLDVEEVLRIGLQTAKGLAAAHAQGLIHRDIKPANLLLEAGDACRVKITDFGLARMVDDVQLTQAGVVAGTPEYMAPEQARGESVDPRADLFSLGSVLYACCTGAAPFQGATALALLRAVNERAAAPIRSLNPEVPVWLEDLIGWLMAKEPGDRCQTAAEVVALLEGYLAHLRQPDTVPEPALPFVSDLGQTSRPPNKAADLPTLLRKVPLRAKAIVLLMIAAFGGASAFFLLAQGNVVVSTEPCHVWSVAISPDGKTLAAGAGWWTTGGEVGVWDLATRKPLQRFADNSGVSSVAFSPDSKLLAFASWGNHVRVLEWDTGKEKAEFDVSGVSRIAFSPDGSLLAIATEGQTMQLWNVAKGELLADLQGDLVRFHCITFSSDGKRVMAGGGEWKVGGISHVAIWDVASKTQVMKLTGHKNTVMSVACSPDGNTIATASTDQTILLWDAQTGTSRKTLRPFRGAESVVFTADSKTLVSCGQDFVVRFWDVGEGKETGALDTQSLHLRTLCLTPDGTSLVVGGANKTLKIFDLKTRKETATLWNVADPQKADMDALPANLPQAEDAPRSYARIRTLLFAIVAIVVLGAMSWFLWRHLRTVRRKSSPSPAAAASAKPESNTARISFTCSGCGTKLNAKGTLAGKKIKCLKSTSVPCVFPEDSQRTNRSCRSHPEAWRPTISRRAREDSVIAHADPKTAYASLATSRKKCLISNVCILTRHGRAVIRTRESCDPPGRPRCAAAMPSPWSKSSSSSPSLRS